MIRVNDRVSLDDSELVERFSRARGPGGQSVNTTDSAVELRFDVRNSPNLAAEVKARLERLAGSRLTAEGMIVLFADGERSQLLNREAARERLLNLIRRALIVPKVRRPTRPTFGSKQRRLEGKARRSGLKLRRGPVREGD